MDIQMDRGLGNCAPILSGISYRDGLRRRLFVCRNHPVSGLHIQIPRSHQLLIGGSVIYCFSLFMLSIAKPQHYYQVHPFFLPRSSLTHACPGIPRTRCRHGYWARNDVCPDNQCSITPLHTPSCARTRNINFWYVPMSMPQSIQTDMKLRRLDRRNRFPNHAEQTDTRSPGLWDGSACGGRNDRRPTCHCKPTGPCALPSDKVWCILETDISEQIV